MPYLRPDEVLSRFATFARRDVRDSLDDEEVAFMRGQIGSMASTLDFLAGELRNMKPALDRQEAVLLDAIDDVESALVDENMNDGIVLDAVATARSRIADAPAAETPKTLRARETALLDACETVLRAIDDHDLAEADARSLRRPLYGFLDARLDAQLHLLGREVTDE